jgi:hypothetical protein
MGHDDRKMQPTQADAHAFVAAIGNESKREDSAALLRLMQAATGCPPVMWGREIVGFGERGGSLLIGFAPRQRELVLYLGDGLEAAAAHLRAAPKVKLGKGCVYIKRLSDVEPQALKRAIQAAVTALG